MGFNAVQFSSFMTTVLSSFIWILPSSLTAIGNLTLPAANSRNSPCHEGISTPAPTTDWHHRKHDISRLILYGAVAVGTQVDIVG